MLADPSETVMVTFAVAAWTPAGNKVTVRVAPDGSEEATPNMMLPLGSSFGLSEVAVTVKLAAAVSTSPMVKLIGPIGTPARVISS